MHPTVAQLVEHVTVDLRISQGRWFDSGRSDFPTLSRVSNSMLPSGKTHAENLKKTENKMCAIRNHPSLRSEDDDFIS